MPWHRRRRHLRGGGGGGGGGVCILALSEPESPSCWVVCVPSLCSKTQHTPDKDTSPLPAHRSTSPAEGMVADFFASQANTNRQASRQSQQAEGGDICWTSFYLSITLLYKFVQVYFLCKAVLDSIIFKFHFQNVHLFSCLLPWCVCACMCMCACVCMCVTPFSLHMFISDIVRSL